MPNIAQEIVKRIDELIAAGRAFKEACRAETVDPEAFESWRLSCLSLMQRAFGSSGVHADRLANVKLFDAYNTCLINLAVLGSAREAIEKGYFFHKDLMLSANVFDSIAARALKAAEVGRLFKAQPLLEVVLSGILEKICASRKIPVHGEEGIAELALKLLDIGAVSPEAAQKIGIWGELLSRDPSEIRKQEFIEAADWIRSFLSRNFSASILILD